MNYQTLTEELSCSTETIRSLLVGITQEDARLKPSAESWSMLEVICHLYDEEREDFREHLDFILHRQKDEWHVIDPQGWVIERKYNEQNFLESQKKFFNERSRSLDWLKSLAASNWDSTFTTEYGSRSAGDLFGSWIAHDNLHIRQLVELRRFRIETITLPYQIAYAGEW